MNSAATIRFIGDEDFSRRYLVQRRDGKFFTGRGWSARLPKARLYNTLAAAQKAYRAVLNRVHRGDPTRAFTLQLRLVVRGSEPFTADDLRRYLAHALQLNFDCAAAGDGPNGTFVMATAALGTLDEVGGTAPIRGAE